MMVEARLHQAAGAMPLPRSDFDAVISRVPAEAAPTRKIRPALIALAIVIVLCGCTTAVAEVRKAQGIQPLLSSRAWYDAESRAEKYGLKLPETFDDYTFRSMRVLVIVPRYMHTLEAMFYPGYRPVSVSYASPTDDYALTVAFGSTKDDYWSVYFGYDSKGLWIPSEDYAAVEYGGFTIHTGLTGYGHPAATWVDAEKDICIRVSGDKNADPLPLAKEIIDASNQ